VMRPIVLRSTITTSCDESDWRGSRLEDQR
jgi:hypothetical protein